MKANRGVVAVAMVLVFLFIAGGPVWAAESWVTDAKTGVKIGWASNDWTLASASWSGPTVDGKAEGKGVLEVTTLRVKDGQVLKGKGEAEMLAGFLEGKAAIRWADGSTYDGYYKKGLFDGKGKYKFANGIIYEGDWKNDTFEGKGLYKWPSGEVYEGDFVNGKREGKGISKLANGEVYEGDWKNDKREGRGVHKWPSGEVYDGDWKDNKREGKGLYKWASGKIYDGDWKNDRAAGSSEYIPKPMASRDAAIAAIKELKGFLSLGADYQNRELTIDPLGLSIVFVREGVKTGTTDFWVGWDHVKIPTNTPYREDKVWTISFNQVKKIILINLDPSIPPSVQIEPFSGSLYVYSVPHARKFMDAIATLALVQNAAIAPYYGFQLYDHSSGNYVTKAYKAAKVPAGAVVKIDNSDVGIELKESDVIVQATYGEKVFPIGSAETWESVCRQVVAGKSEVTIQAQFSRNGVMMTKDIRVFNVGFGVSIPQSSVAVSQTQTVPPRSFGVVIRPLEVEEAKTMGLPNADGFMVVALAKDGPAERMQVKLNDVLVAINGIEITSAAQLRELVGKGPVMSAKVFRDGTVVSLQAPLVL